jgi:hypothetical protein
MKTTKAVLGTLGITLAIVAQVEAQSLLTNGLVAHYPLIGNANDASGNGWNGAALNVLFLDGGSPFYNSAHFDGTDSLIVISNSADLNLLPLSVSVWVKEETTTAAETGIITNTLTGLPTASA